jgi:hypothetical protein
MYSTTQLAATNLIYYRVKLSAFKEDKTLANQVARQPTWPWQLRPVQNNQLRLCNWCSGNTVLHSFFTTASGEVFL